MIYYSENPNRKKMATVITVYGEVEYKVNCLKRLDKYYVKNKDYIQDPKSKKWKKMINIMWDYESNCRSHIIGLRKGVVGWNVESNSPIIGHFRPNSMKNIIVVIDGTKWIALSEEVLPKEFFQEDYSKGEFFYTKNMTSLEISRLKDKKLEWTAANNSYSIDDNKFISIFEISREWRKNRKDFFSISPRNKHLGKYLDSYTFGVEIETTKGKVPDYILERNAIKVCKDGSLANNEYPPEYVTLPVNGDEVLQIIDNICPELQKRSDFDTTCSTHVHVGKKEFSRLFIVSLYCLSSRIQGEMIQMFPAYKANPPGKNYAKLLQKLPHIKKPTDKKIFNNIINEFYKNIYTYFTGLYMDRNHHKNINVFGPHKWKNKARYYWVNFSNILFGNRKTIEFRIHQPTFNSLKLKIWTFMCTAMMKYAEEKPIECIFGQVSIFDVFSIFDTSGNTKIGDVLKDYYKNRKLYYAAMYRENGLDNRKDIMQDYNFNIQQNVF